jgi:hypothetical protein
VSEASQVFVRLLDEGVDVWRPIDTERIDEERFRIVDQPYDREAERWEFEPGTTVACEPVETSDGEILAAVRSVAGH